MLSLGFELVPTPLASEDAQIEATQVRGFLVGHYNSVSSRARFWRRYMSA